MIRFFMIACVLMLAAGVSLGQGSKFEGDGWSFVGPDGWEPVPDEYLAYVNRDNRMVGQQMVGGFHLGEDPYLPTASVYVVVVEGTLNRPARASDLAELNAIDLRELRTSYSTEELLSGLPADQKVFDLERSRSFRLTEFRVESDSAALRGIETDLETLQQDQHGLHATVQLLWYFDREDLGQRQGVADSIDSFEWEAGAALGTMGTGGAQGTGGDGGSQPGQPDRPSSVVDLIVPLFFCCGLVGVGAVGIGLNVWLVMRARRKRAERDALKNPSGEQW